MAKTVRAPATLSTLLSPHPSDPSLSVPRSRRAITDGPRNSQREENRRLLRHAAAVRVRAPSTVVLALLAALAADQAQALSVSANSAPTERRVHSPASPDVPDFLCPALLAAAPPLPSSVSTSTLGGATTATATQRQQDDEVTASTSAPEPDAENPHPNPYPYLARSTSFTAFPPLHFSTPTQVHHDLPPANTQFVFLDDDDDDSDEEADGHYQNSEKDAIASGQSASRRLVSNFSLRSQDEAPYARADRTRNPSEARQRFRRADTTTTSSSSQCSELYTSRTIPDRYELGNDGRWHKLSVSSSCTLCECTSTNQVNNTANYDSSSTGVTNNDTSYEADSSISASTSSTTPSASASSTSTVVLPDGWDRREDSVVYQVPFIVIASLLVAAAVTGAVWLTFFWRRRRRTAKKLALARDLEKRRKAEGIESESEYEDDGGDHGDGGMGSRRRRRMRDEIYPDRARREKNGEKSRARWSRATAQWKAHVRWVHRRKRGRTGTGIGERQREDAMASGISLTRSVASSGSPAANASRTSLDRNGSRRGSVTGDRSGLQSATASVRGEAGRLGDTVVGDSTVTATATAVTGSSSRVRGSRDRIEGSDEGGLSDARRRDEISTSGQNQNMDQEQQLRGIGSNSDMTTIASNLQSSGSVSGPGASSPSSSSSTLSFSTPEDSRDYDRPPPEEREEVQGPPAYRSRRSVDGVVLMTSRTTRRRNEKRPLREGSSSRPGYVPAPEDYAPYSSGDDEDGDYRERRLSMDGRRRSRDVQTNMHIAVDDKQALARLALYASAPPIPSSPPPPMSPLSPSTSSSLPPTSTSTSTVASSSHPHSLSSVEPNAPPEPEWERFEDYDYAYAFGLHLTGGNRYGADSPGAGPGPSTVYARSRSTSPSSRSGFGSPSRSRCTSCRDCCDVDVEARTPAYSRSQYDPPAHPSFPPPPAPISSKLAYAPADAGLSLSLVHPSAPPPLPPSSVHLSGGAYNLGPDDFGLGIDDTLVVVEGLSAPPFSPYPSYPSYSCDSDGVRVVVAPSAPPLFDEDEEDGGFGGGRGEGASAPPEDDLEVNAVNGKIEPESSDRAGDGEEELEYVDLRQGEEGTGGGEVKPETAHIETADRNAVLSAVR